MEKRCLVATSQFVQAGQQAIEQAGLGSRAAQGARAARQRVRPICAAIIIGLPANHAFFATLPTEGGKAQSAEALLANHHCCASIAPQDLCADMLAVKVNGRNFAAVGASRRRDLQILTDAVRALGFRYVRVEPAPGALLRSTTPNPSGRMGLRLLVDGDHMLAALVVGQHPLLWRPLELSETDDFHGADRLSRAVVRDIHDPAPGRDEPRFHRDGRPEHQAAGGEARHPSWTSASAIAKGWGRHRQRSRVALRWAEWIETGPCAGSGPPAGSPAAALGFDPARRGCAFVRGHRLPEPLALGARNGHHQRRDPPGRSERATTHRCSR